MPAKLENESVTFRITGDVLLTMRQLSQENGVSLNTLVNNVLRSYVDWESVATKAGFGVFQKETIREAFNLLDDEKIAKIAAKSAEAYKDALLLLKGGMDLDLFIDTLKDRSKRTGFNLREFEEAGEKRLILQHDMGIKWSSFSKIFHEKAINSLGHRVRVEATEGTVIISIPSSDDSDKGNSISK